jgi:hypothetical protein
MISTATKADKAQITDITARAGVFNQEEIDSVPVMLDTNTLLKKEKNTLGANLVKLFHEDQSRRPATGECFQRGPAR